MSAELTSVILLGLGCAANPWGIMIAVLLLDARRGHGIVYVVAWVGAISPYFGLPSEGTQIVFAANKIESAHAWQSRYRSWFATRALHARSVRLGEDC